MKLKMRVLPGLALAALLSLPACAAYGSDSTTQDSASYAQTLKQAQALEDNGDPGKAYALLKPLVMDHAGEERFDYLLGISALDSGHPAKATLAFERVLAVDPGNAAARLDMARAYYQLGDFARARPEFQTVLRQNIPALARSNIEKYLDAMDDRATGGSTRWHGHLDLNAGHDSNVNAATSQSQIVVDSLSYTPVTLSSVNLAAPDGYHGSAAGGDVQHALNAHWSLDGGLEWARRAYNFEYAYSTEALGGSAGISYGAGKEHVRFGLGHTRNELGGSHIYDIGNASLEWRHAYSPANTAGLFLTQSDYRYARVQMKPNDFDQTVAGAGGQHVSRDGRTVVSGSLFHGMEKDVSTAITTATPDGGRPDGPRRFNGIRLGINRTLDDGIILFAGAAIQVSHYGRVNALFLRARSDRYTDASAGLDWDVARRWTLRPQFSFYRNVSNIPIYAYERRDITLTLRRDFQ